MKKTSSSGLKISISIYHILKGGYGLSPIVKRKDLNVACGFRALSGRQPLMSRIEKLGLNTDHIGGTPGTKEIPIDKIFVVDSKYRFTPGIKKRLVTDLGWRYECNECKNVHFIEQDGALTWMNKPVLLQLDHINGIHDDNRVENLRFLCALCHSQTSTWCGKNNKKRRVMQAWVEDGKIE